MPSADVAHPEIAVLGGGSWGTALAILLARAGSTVHLWARNADHRADMAASHQNARYLPDISFPEGLNVHAETSIEQLAARVDHFLLVVPSQAFRATASTLAAALAVCGKTFADITIICGTKGFDPDTGELLSRVIQQEIGAATPMAVVTGPSFAGETAKGLPTALTVAASSDALADQVAHWFNTDSTRLYTNTDLIGVQLGGAIKNVIAVAAGISDGLGFGANARAALITRGLAELTRLGIQLGGKPETFTGLAAMGDLILTCTDNQSRNRRFGLAIGRGINIEQALADIGQEVEGYHTVKTLAAKSEQLGTAMPITDAVHQVLYQNLPPAEAVKGLLNRAIRAE